MNIGYIGLGALGHTLAGRFLEKHTLHAWDLSSAALAVMVAKGAKPVSSPAAMASNCEVILLCLPRSTDVQELLFGSGGLAESLLPGALVIDQTSGVPGATRAMADHLARRGVAMLDAAVSGSPYVVAAGSATLMAAGPEAVWARAMPLLKEISPTVLMCGSRVGDGQAMKMVNNAMNGACRLGTLEVVALGRKMGMDLRSMTEALNAGAAANQTTERMLPAIAEGKPSTDFALALMLKDLSQAVSLGIESGVPMPIVAATRSLLQIGVNTLGYGAKLEDMVGVVESMAAARFAGSGPNDASEQSNPTMVVGAVEALGTAVTLECVGAGLKYGLTLENMAPIFVRASGWSGPLRRILPALASDHPIEGLDLTKLVSVAQEAAEAAIRCGAPTTILNAVRASLEAALSLAGPAPPGDALLRFYERCAGIHFISRPHQA